MKRKNYLLMGIMILVIFSTIYVHAQESCQGIFGQELIDEIKSIFRIIQIIAPIALLLLTSFDFAKVVFSDNKDGLNKAKNNFLKRAVAVLIIFFSPYIITLILDLINDSSMRSCLDQMKN